MAVTWIQPETSPNMIPVHSHDATLPDQTSQLHLRGLHGLHIWHHLQRANGHSPNHLLASAPLYGIPAPLLAVAWGIGEWAPRVQRDIQYFDIYYPSDALMWIWANPTQLTSAQHHPIPLPRMSPSYFMLLHVVWWSKPRSGVNLHRSFSVVRGVGGSGRNQICVKQDKVPKRTTSVSFLSGFPWDNLLYHVDHRTMEKKCSKWFGVETHVDLWVRVWLSPSPYDKSCLTCSVVRNPSMMQ